MKTGGCFRRISETRMTQGCHTEVGLVIQRSIADNVGGALLKACFLLANLLSLYNYSIWHPREAGQGRCRRRNTERHDAVTCVGQSYYVENMFLPCPSNLSFCSPWRDRKRDGGVLGGKSQCGHDCRGYLTEVSSVAAISLTNVCDGLSQSIVLHLKYSVGHPTIALPHLWSSHRFWCGAAMYLCITG